MRRKVVISVVLVIVGLAIVLVVPPAYEGPLLLYINERHVIRLVDALGLAVAVPSWLYLNALLVRLWARRGKRTNERADIE